MASTSNRRRLAELLKEQQEPFVLEIYLLERGFRPKSFDTTSSYIRSNRKSCKSTSRQFLNVARNLYNKLVSINHVHGLINYGLSGEKKHGRNQLASEFDETVAAESDRISFATSCNSCEAARGGVMKLWRVMEDNKDCSPVSVLEEIEFLQGFSVYNAGREKRHLESGRKLQKKKLDDSILLNQSRRGSMRQLSVDKANMKEMVRSELISGSKQEWDDLEACKTLIVLEIEDSVLEDIMNEIL